MRAVLLAAIASIGLVGCVGELDTMNVDDNDDGSGSDNGSGSGSDGSAAAKAAYESNVYATLKGKCISCHNAAGPVNNLSGFITADVSNGWTTINGFQSVVGNWTEALAPVLSKPGTGPNHTTITYDTAERQKIVDWLALELAWRNAGTGSGSGSGTGSGTGTAETPAQATTRVMGAWSGCMTKTNFDAANMASAWGNMTANNNQRCSNCHASGDGGFIATVDSTLFFDVISQNKYYMLQYFIVKLDLANLANSKMEINTQSFLGVSQGQDPHREHPRFNATTNNGMNALNNFYTSTMNALTAAGTAGCGPSKIVN